MKPRRRGAIGLLSLGCAALLAGGFGLDLPWLAPTAAGCGLAAGLLGWLAKAEPPARPAPAPRGAMADMAPLLRELAEEMVRLKRDSAEASRGMAEARASGARMVQAAATAIARLDDSAETSAIAARALSMLPGIADSHAQRIELMAARAEQALALVPETLAMPPAFDGALARLEAIALPDTGALREAVERLDRLPGEISQAMHGSLAEAHDAAATLLDQAASRIEAARPDPLLAMGLMEATERLDALAPPMERARQGAEAAAGQMESALAAATARLDDALERIGAAEAARATRQEIEAARLDALLGHIEATPLGEALDRVELALGELRPETSLVAEFERLARLIQDATASLPVVGEALQALLEPLGAAAAALPPMTQSAQRATEALLRAAQANVALAARAREATPERDAEPAPPRLLENLDDTIRGLQSLSTAIAAAAGRRLENAA